ncbi:MAG: PQQ-binding-like beta-propeller repeat protein, partial [Verrucomicrobiota bacterium]
MFNWQAAWCGQGWRGRWLGGLGILAVGLGRSAADWPQFRGPAGDGHSEAREVPLHWNAASNVVWKIAIPGSGWSSPVLQGGNIYLTTAVPLAGEGEERAPGRSLRALSLEAATGRVQWDVEVFRQEAGGPG